MLSLLRFFRLVLLLGVLMFSAAVMGVVGLLFYFAKDLPKLDSLKDYSPPIVSEVYDTHGNKIGEFWKEKRYILPPNEIPKTIVQAIISSEDDRFFEHKGIDYQGIVRAFLENLKAGHVVQGGSTITQQVTKSLLLSSEKTIIRKIKEAILATRIEKNFSKDEILYLYLNQIFLGNRAYGVEAAARNYFHKTAKELNIAEAAMIAGLAKAPSDYSPINNFEAAKNRQGYVIQRMYEEGYITKDQADKAKALELQIYREGIDKDFNYQYAPWFTEYARRTVQEKFGEQAPYTMGLRIDMTVDVPMQKAADAAVMQGLRELDKREGYAGAVRKITPADYASFSDEEHLKIIAESSQDKPVIPALSKEQLLAQPTPIDKSRYYQALITNVDRTKQELGIKVGHESGAIRMIDYTWARKRNLNSAGYDGASYIKDPHGTFAEGDIIWVKPKNLSPEVLKSKGYQEGINYFSLEQYPEAESALFSYEPQTGFVRAMVGGKDFKESEFNRALQSLRQTGSAIKPLIYAAGLDKGYTPNSVIEDAPLSVEYAPGRFWSPKNYGGGYSGPTSFRSALVNSRNIVTVKILMDVGLDYTVAYGRKLGILSPMKKVYAMALGANDLKLAELSRAYGTFATGGIRPDLVFIKRITDRTGKVLEEYHPRQIVPYKEQLANMKASGKGEKNKDGLHQEMVDEAGKNTADDKLNLTDIEKKILYGNYIPDGYAISPRTAYTMVQIMNDVVNFGTGFKVKALKRPAAGKTGTTNDETDVWFVGFVPDLFAGVWVGFDKVQKIGSHETGGGTAAPIFLYYMQEVLKDKPVAQFVIPDDINQEALKAPIDITSGDAEAGGVEGGGTDFFIHDF